MTGGHLHDCFIDTHEMAATRDHATIPAYDRVMQAARFETERPHATRNPTMACRPGGLVAVIGVYGGLMDKFPVGAFTNERPTMKTGPCHVHRYLRPTIQASWSHVAWSSTVRPRDIRPSNTSSTSA
jgi:threonine dehydrogenase-like Zn-dependent dehydrogenase